MKKLLAVSGVTGLVLLASCQSDVTRPDADPAAPSAEPAQALQAGQVVQGEFIVLFDRALPDPAAAAQGLARAHGFQVNDVYGTAVKGFSAAIPARAVAAIRNDARVARVEPVEVRTFAVQELPTGIDRIETDRNPTVSTDGSGSVVVDHDIAIIDSGIDSDHADLNVAGGINFANGGSDNWDDGNGHGTHVAGTAAAKDNGDAVVGVAPGAPVWAVRVCGNSGFCFTSDMVAGIDWVAERKAAGEIDFAVANMSITTADDAKECTGSSGAVHEAICGLVSEGVVFSLAAGNDGREKLAFPEVLAVSAVADFDGKGGGAGSPTCRTDDDETLANFSNWGGTIDVAAPGVCILSTWKDGGTNVISGTSMAAPHVTGAVALYLHANDLMPATDAAGVDAIEEAIIDAALAEGTDVEPCSYDNEHSEEGSIEPMLFVNGDVFGGNGGCDVAGSAATDIAVTEVSAPSSVVQGDVVSVDVTVENVGTEDVTSDITVTLTDETDGVTIGTQTISGGLAAGASTTLGYSWDTNTSSTGDHTLIGSHDFADEDGSNDSKSTVVTVESSATDIAVTAVSAPSSVVQGDVVSVDVTVENVGNQDVASDVTVTLTDDTEGVTIGTETINGGLAAGASTTLTYSWETGGATLGDHTLTGSHDLEDDDSSNDSKSTTVTVQEESSNMHVGDLDASSLNNGRTWDAIVTITVHDGSHDVLADADVSGAWSGLGGGSVVTSICTTDAAGQCQVRANGMHKSNGTVTFSVDGITHATLTYDATANHDPDGDSDGTTITVSKP